MGAGLAGSQEECSFGGRVEPGAMMLATSVMVVLAAVTVKIPEEVEVEVGAWSRRDSGDGNGGGV